MLGPLNAGLVAKETFGGSPAGRLRWLLGQRSPFVRDGLAEIPVYAPLDCDLLGLPKPTDDTSPEALAYTKAVVQAAAVTPGRLSMITFHDWIVSGGNRLSLLGDCLATAHENGVDIATIAQRPAWRFTKLPDGNYEITEAKSDAALTAVSGNGQTVRIIVAPWHNTDDQKWRLEKIDPATLTM